ncbi:MAG: hypothetical protein RLZZ546_575, partial [Bacteroidota bacterium]
YLCFMNHPFLQAELSSDIVDLFPLREEDFETLYEAASDPLIWEQHPNKDRYKREVFEVYFKGAMDSGGAYLIKDFIEDKVIGSTRYYDYDEKERSVFIGYTFIKRDYWGMGYNSKIKALMLQNAFFFVDKVFFHVGAQNVRSQIAMQRIGGIKVRELDVAYYGEPSRINFEYVIHKK